MAFLDQWKAPLLLPQGDDDRNVVFTEGIKLTRELLKRPHERLVQRVVPHETHDLYLTFEHMTSVMHLNVAGQNPAHRLRCLELLPAI